MAVTFTTKQQAIAPTAENPPARLENTITIVMASALGATKLNVKQKVTTITRVTAETATRFPPLLGFTIFLTNQQELPTKVVAATTSGPALAHHRQLAYTVGKTTNVSTVEPFCPMRKAELFGITLAKAQCWLAL